MDITFRAVRRDNFTRVIDMKVAPGQENFVASNLYSIAEASLEPSWMPLAIYAGEELVGFAMFGRDDETRRWWIMRYMIGIEHQGKGYGTAALLELINLMVERHGCREVFLDYAADNEIAGRLYARAGFVPTREEAGAIEARLDLTGRGLIRDPGDNRRRPGELPTDAPSPQYPAADA
jgi:diamine N-acetyltransferase